jgi:hypothetical protein
MSRGSRFLSQEETGQLVRMWSEDIRFGSRFRFAQKLAEVIGANDAPSDATIKAADKRLERLEKQQSKLTDSTANHIAIALGITRDDLDNRLIGNFSTTAILKPDDEPAEPEAAYRHFEIVHEYAIADKSGHLTTVKTAERVEILRREIVEGGSYWESQPHNVEAFYKPVGNQNVSLWRGAFPVEVARVVKTGKLYRWDTHHEPGLRRGEQVWFLTRFELNDEFVQNLCRDSFHSMEQIGSFTWIVRFPAERPARRWWITTDFNPHHTSGATLESKIGVTREIKWSVRDLPKGSVFFINWEW